MGIPVAQGRRAWPVPQMSGTLNLAIMRSIQSDNYKFIRHMIIHGWTPTNPSACSFPITINRDGEKEMWQVSQATPLHYAVCSGSLQAAAAILIAFPELAFQTCKVVTESSRMPAETMWTTLDLTSFFGKLYMTLDRERHLAYTQASLVLLRLQQDPARVPFMQFATARERLEQAGSNPFAPTETVFSHMR